MTILNKTISSYFVTHRVRPNINPRVSESKEIDFITQWEEITHTTTLKYTKVIL